jgi:hypothetical protein
MLFFIDKNFINTKKNKLYKAKFIAKKQERLIIVTFLKFNKAII